MDALAGIASEKQRMQESLVRDGVIELIKPQRAFERRYKSRGGDLRGRAVCARLGVC